MGEGGAVVVDVEGDGLRSYQSSRPTGVGPCPPTMPTDHAYPATMSSTMLTTRAAHTTRPPGSGEFTTESNRAFDASLRERDPEWGYRDVEDLKGLAETNGLAFREAISMPANNFLMLFGK